MISNPIRETVLETGFLGGVSSVLGQKHLLVLLLIGNKKEINGSKQRKN
jgi:hypothetical protein